MLRMSLVFRSFLSHSWCTDEVSAVRNTWESAVLPTAVDAVFWYVHCSCLTVLMLWSGASALQVNWSKLSDKQNFSSAWLTEMLFRAEDVSDLDLLGKGSHMERFLNLSTITACWSTHSTSCISVLLKFKQLLCFKKSKIQNLTTAVQHQVLFWWTKVGYVVDLIFFSWRIVKMSFMIRACR